MSFSVDKQTLEDLNLLGKYKANSVFNLFSHTLTRGGERLLEAMFRQPLSDAVSVNRRSCIFRYFQQQQTSLPVTGETFERVEHYLSTAAHPNRFVALLNTCRRKMMQFISGDKEYGLIGEGLSASVAFVRAVYDFNRRLDDAENNPYAGTIREVQELIEHKKLQWILEEKEDRPLSLWRLAKYDHLLRAECRAEMERLLDVYYEYDVYITVSDVARKQGFAYARACPPTTGENHIRLRDVRHPQLPRAIGNTVAVDHEQNVIFLTGANMAGKSTFMKAFGIALYLGHMGFPVAASEMEFSMLDGMYTSINVPDNLNLGYSHFYAEVLRVKQVAEEVSRGKNLLIVFDELFKGTNVKDAYDATVAVTEAFAAHRNCSFIISTHIVEAGHTLRERCRNFRFVYLPTVMQGNMPTYTYQLQEGITADRHGMMIIRNEHIVEIIKGEINVS